MSLSSSYPQSFLHAGSINTKARFVNESAYLYPDGYLRPNNHEQQQDPNLSTASLLSANDTTRGSKKITQRPKHTNVIFSIIHQQNQHLKSAHHQALASVDQLQRDTQKMAHNYGILKDEITSLLQQTELREQNLDTYRRALYNERLRYTQWQTTNIQKRIITLDAAPQVGKAVIASRKWGVKDNGILRKEIEDEDDLKCVICLGMFEMGETVQIMPCRHWFHMECIDEWHKTRMECPRCTKKVALRMVLKKGR